MNSRNATKSNGSKKGKRSLSKTFKSRSSSKSRSRNSKSITGKSKKNKSKTFGSSARHQYNLTSPCTNNNGNYEIENKLCNKHMQ